MSTSAPKFNFDEDEWVDRISRNVAEEVEEETDTPVCIFNVPKPLMICNPYSFLPQQLAIGPYHYFTPELYEMEKYKIAAGKNIQKGHQNLKFQHIVDRLKRYDSRIRSHYHKYLNINGDTLAWTMALDAAFLLEFFSSHPHKEGKKLTKISSRISRFIDSAGTKSIHDAILRDIVMLENQIPLFLLRKVLEWQFSSLDLADELLFSMLMGFHEEISPFRNMEQQPNSHIVIIKKSVHLLDFLYRAIVPEVEDSSHEICIVVDHEQLLHGVKEDEEQSLEVSSHMKTVLGIVRNAFSKLDHGPVRKIKEILISKPFEVIFKLPLKIISHVPGIKLIIQPIEHMLFPNKEEAEATHGDSKTESNKIPLMEEITIPSVTDLSKAGVCFAPTYQGISSISFDVKTKTFHLPAIDLDVNSEVVLRNLVAYESCNASGPLVFTRYTELMNGIIDTGEDVKFLRGKGIIVNHLKSDEEVAKLWNGMSKSIKLTKIDFIDKAIGDVNAYYSHRLSVKAKNFMRGYVFGSWKILTLMAALFMLFLTALQSFCTVYSCPRALGRQVEMLQ